MLKKKLRLTKEVIAKRRWYSGVRTPLFFTKETASVLPYARFAVIVAKKVERRATKRNRVRRRFYRALKELSDHWGTPPRDVVLYVLPEALAATEREIGQTLHVLNRDGSKLRK